MITFNNIVERFEIFAENHFFIKSFSFGSPDDVDLSKFEEFPLMHLVYTGATYDAGTKTYNLEVYILDVPNDKKGKVIPQKEAISDSEQCAEDILADIRMGGNIFLFAQDYEVVNATTTPLEEETKNVLSGVLLDLSVAIPYEWDACNAPIDGVAPGGGEVVYARRGVLRMLTLDGSTDVQSVRTIKVTNGTLTDDGDGVVTLDTGGVETLEALTDVTITNAANGQVIKYQNGIWINAADGGAISLNDLTDVIISQPSTGEFFRYDGDEWVNDSANKSDVGLGNVDNTSDANKPVSTATQTALDLKADITSVPTELDDLNDVQIIGTPTLGQALVYGAGKWLPGAAGATELGDLDDVNTTGAGVGSLLTYNGASWDISGSQLPTDDIYFHQRYETESEALRTGATATTELYFTCTAQGNGLAESASSDTPTAGKIIRRKIYYSDAGFADPDTGTWVEFTPAPADDASFATVKAALLEYLKARTGGTVPISLKQTWEEVAAAPAFTGLLNETYGSGAEAAYSTRRLNGNVTDCMVIRRASDSTTTTIGFDGSGNIDEAAINTFCTGTTCTVYQWLDQSGNGNTATAAAPANEPTIYTGGALVKENGKLALEFFNDRLDALFSSKTLTTQSSFSVASIVIGSRYDRLFTQMLGANTDVPSYIPMVRNNLNNVISSYVGSFVSPLTFTYGTPFLFNSIHSGSTLTNYLNGSSGASVNNTLSETIDRYVIGARPDAIDNELNGTVQELIIYDSDKSGTDQTSIEENVGDYFTQNTPLLDTYTGAAAAYSLRLLDSTYTGSAIRVRRSSDNTEQDIGFNVFGELDTVSLLAFAGTGDAFVKTWYDQSGNSNDATQTATGSQPQIVSSGAVIVENGKPAVEFDGTDDALLTGVDLLIRGTFSVATATGTGCVFGSETGNSEFLRSQSSTSYQLRNNVNLPFSTDTTVQSLVYAANDSTSELAVNGATAVTDATLQTDAFDSLALGRRNTGVFLNGNLQEVVIYETNKSSVRTNIETNIATFYDITI